MDPFVEELSAATRCRIVGTLSSDGYLPRWDGAAINTSKVSGIVSHDVDDQVVEVWAGTTLGELQEELAKHGQCIPYANDTAMPPVGTTVGGVLAMNLPHALSAQCGGPRDWLLGATVVRADGTIAKSGSKAVKSVAGYDAHKLFVGSRGELGAIAKAVLRTLPIKALPRHQAVVKAPCSAPCFILRCLRSDFEAAVERASGLVAYDPASCTIWSQDEPDVPEHAWMIGPGGARKRSPQPAHIEAQARRVFDPQSKLAPGWSA